MKYRGIIWSRLLLVSSLILLYRVIIGQVRIADSEYISLEQGLSDRTIKDIIRDKDGYLWIATRNGLNKYNGRSFVIFDDHPNSKNRISAKDIQQICAKNDGSIVIRYETNRRFVDILRPTQSQTRKLFLNKENGINGEVEDIFLDQETGEVYVLVDDQTYLSIHRLIDLTHFEQVFRINDFISKPSSKYILKILGENYFWINDNNYGLLQTDSLGIIQNRFSFEDLNVPSTSGLVDVFLLDFKNRLWISFEHSPELLRYDRGQPRPLPDSLFGPNHDFKNAWKDEMGNALFLSHQNKESQVLMRLDSQDLRQSLKFSSDIESAISEVYGQDFTHLLFIGTESGIYKIIQYKHSVGTLDLTNNPEHQVSNVVSDHEGSIFIAYSGPNPFLWTEQLDTNLYIELDYLKDTSGNEKWLWSGLIYRPAGYLWGSLYSDIQNRGTLIKIDVSDFEITNYPYPQKIIQTIDGRDGNLWMISGTDTTEAHLSYIDTITGNFHHLIHQDGRNPLSGYLPTFLYQDKHYVFWVGSESGILKIDPRQDLSEVFNYEEDNYFGLSSNQISVITEDDHNQIWIGTKSSGISIYNPVMNDFRNYDSRDGLSDNTVVGLLSDLNGNIWIPTMNGLSCFDAQLQSFRNFGEKDGFHSVVFNPFSSYMSPSGIIYLGTENVVNKFDPILLLERNITAPILISELSYYRKAENAIVTYTNSLSGIAKIRLPARNRFFQCVFALADYSYPHLNQYMYILEGYDREWNYLGTQNHLRFNNLAAGKYTLRIRGADKNGNISNKELALEIIVGDFFYRTWWFILLCLSCVVFLIYLYYRFKLQQAIRLERIRTKISSDLHDDVGGLLSGLAMQTELLEYTARNEDIPKLKRISEMSRNAMAQMRDVIWATDARKDRFEDLLLRMKEHAAEMLFPKGIFCHFDIKNVNVEKKIPIDIRQNLYLIFKEAITNIAKHSNASRAEVSLKKEGKKFEMKVIDNGDPDEIVSDNGSSTGGIGLSNMQLRAENIDADLKIQRNGGYCIVVRMNSFI